MEWDLDKYFDEKQQPAATPRPAKREEGGTRRQAASGQQSAQARRPAAGSRPRQGSANNRRDPNARRRAGSLPPWLLVLFCLLYDGFFFRVWSNRMLTSSFNVGRLLTLLLMSISFALLTALVSTIGKKRKPQLIIAMVTVIFWGVMYLMEYFILDSFKNYYTFAGIFTGAGNAGQADFASRTIGLVFKNLWRVAVIALPIVGYFLANRYLRLPRILTRGVRRYLAVAGVGILALGLLFGSLISPDRKKMNSEYNFTEAVRGFGLPMGLVLEQMNGGEDSGFVIDPDVTAWKPEDTQATEPRQTENTGATGETGDTSLSTEPTEPPKPRKTYNMMDIDFDAVINNSNSDRVKSVSRYVSSLVPSKTNEYTGLFEGKNLILIAAEAFSAEVIDENLTPALYRLANKGIKFTDYYQPAWGGSTSTGEFSILTGIEPAHAVKSIQETIGKNMYLTMGNQLRRLGYFSRAYHNNDYTYYNRDETHENLGYDKWIGMGNGMEEGVKKRWPASDQEMIDFTVPQYIDQQPFSIYYMSVSGHGLYSWHGNSMSSKNRDVVKDLPYSDTIKAYIAANMELEYAMEDLLQMLEDAGIADDTVIVMSSDHYAYCLEKSDTWGNPDDYLSEFFGYKVQNCFDQDHNALIIWSGCIEDKNIVVDTPTYSLDIVPTLSNLFGVEYDSRLLVGRDVFSDQEPLVLWPNRSWKTDKGSYNASTGTFTPKEGVTVPEGYTSRIAELVKNKISYSDKILSMDYFEILFGNK